MADEGKEANAKFAVVKYHCAKIYQPSDYRWVIKVTEVKMSSVEPVIGFLREEVRPGEGDQLEQEQPGDKDQRSP